MVAPPQIPRNAQQGKVKAAPGAMREERGHYSEAGGRTLPGGRGYARPWTLLYVTPKDSASAITAYPHDV
jgi:hypothetical protein